MDKRSLLNPEQAAALLDWIRRRPRRGKRLHAFFARLYYCGPHPEEAVAIPKVGKQWTDTGEIQGETRTVPGIRP